ncbi:MAG: ion channel [Candidatus Marinimicrobia bacterium]|nr:ion channel [Candidatus Neomarinimicrobiota bacterium]MDP6789181.1 ion channel [Candidatus Neomarinimicrobiota bacterium]MDP7072811.1 ion channel [Candidatus Neomarinimicrobiota bacterium]
MRRRLRTLLRNSFFQVFGGILFVMVIGGFIVKLLEPGDITQENNPFWWAIVTMTTVGYGDFSPETPAGRLVAVLIMFAGISLVSLLTATISSIFVAQKIREGKGLEKLDLKDHIILCGWNQNADRIMDSISNLSGKKKNEVVMINDLNEDEVNTIKNKYPRLNLFFVSGDFTQEQILERANLKESHTVIIIPHAVEASLGSPDEKTIFATLTIKSIEPNIRVVAYLVDRDNLTHIQRANADEIVISDDFGAFMLASHVMDPGVPQTVKKLMDSRSSSRFKRIDIPVDYVGKSYQSLFSHLREESGTILVGLFSEEENLGIGAILSSDSSSLDAFIERKLKEGGISLQEESKINVVINPRQEYLIKENERAIVIP